MIGVNERVEGLLKTHSSAGEKLGYSRLLLKHNKKELAEPIPTELLPEVVNRAFWEHVNEFSSPEQRPFLAGDWWGRYHTVLVYHDQIDLTRAGEFSKGAPVGGPWVTDEVVGAFRRARDAVTHDSAVVLALPIIHRAFDDVMRWDSPMKPRRETLKKGLREFIEYMGEPQVQETIRGMTKEVLTHLDRDDRGSRKDGAAHAMNRIGTLLKYLQFDNDVQRASFFSANLPAFTKDTVHHLVDTGFPVKLLTPEKKGEISALVEAHFEDLSIYSRMPKSSMPQSIVSSFEFWEYPAIKFAKEAFAQGYLDQKTAKSMVEGELAYYLKRPTTPMNYVSHAILGTVTDADVRSGIVDAHLLSEVRTRARKNIDSRLARRDGASRDEPQAQKQQKKTLLDY